MILQEASTESTSDEVESEADAKKVLSIIGTKVDIQILNGRTMSLFWNAVQIVSVPWLLVAAMMVGYMLRVLVCQSD